MVLRETVYSPPPSARPEFKNRLFCARRRYISVKTSIEIQGFCQDLGKTRWFSRGAFLKLEKLGGFQFCAWVPAVGSCPGPACESSLWTSRSNNIFGLLVMNLENLAVGKQPLCMSLGTRATCFLGGCRAPDSLPLSRRIGLQDSLACLLACLLDGWLPSLAGWLAYLLDG